jgi:hypothetical protein
MNGVIMQFFQWYVPADGSLWGEGVTLVKAPLPYRSDLRGSCFPIPFRSGSIPAVRSYSRQSVLQQSV